jgi:Tfp pilus assembly protein PilN
MAQLSSPLLRKAFRFGSGAGIVIGERDLEVCLVRVRPGGARILALRRIENFRERPAAEWGAEYAKLLSESGLTHLAALAVLPRNEVIVRLVQLPGVDDKDAASAIQFQLDTLHPFAADEVFYDFQRAGRSGAFVVAIAERRVVDSYTALFAEAGVALAGLTFSGGAVFPSLRLFNEPLAEGFVAVAGLAAEDGPPFELYGESPTYPLLSVAMDAPADRAAALSAAELRLAPEEAARDLIDVLPAWKSAPDRLDFSPAGRSRLAMPWSAGLAASCPRLCSPVNLLPPEARTVTSRGIYVPTIVLGVVLALLTTALGLRAYAMDRRYSALLESQIRQLEPAAKQVEILDKQIASAADHVREFDEFRKQTRRDLDLVQDLTQTIAPPGWITGLQIDPNAVIISGEAEQADTLLKKLDSSPYLTAAEFTTPLSRNSSGEMFRIRCGRKPGPPAGGAK